METKMLGLFMKTTFENNGNINRNMRNNNTANWKKT
jgi:hypothetical protein